LVKDLPRANSNYSNENVEYENQFLGRSFTN